MREALIMRGKVKNMPENAYFKQVFMDYIEETRKLVKLKTSLILNEITQLKEENENLILKCK